MKRSDVFKNVVVDLEVHKKLTEECGKDETYNDLLRRILGLNRKKRD